MMQFEETSTWQCSSVRSPTHRGQVLVSMVSSQAHVRPVSQVDLSPLSDRSLLFTHSASSLTFGRCRTWSYGRTNGDGETCARPELARPSVSPSVCSTVTLPSSPSPVRLSVCASVCLRARPSEAASLVCCAGGSAR